MSIVQATSSITGLVGVQPSIIFLNTTDTLATVTTAGYLTNAVKEQLVTISVPTTNHPGGTLALVNTTNGTVILQVSVTGIAPNLIYSLVTPPNGGGQIFEGNVQAGSSGVPGGFISYPATAASGNLFIFATNNVGNTQTTITNAAFGQATALTIPDPGAAAASFLLTQSAGTQSIGTGNLALTLGTLTLGSSGHASSLTLFPGTAANGTLLLVPVNAGGAFNTTISNGVMGQSTVFTLPDPGNALARVLVAATATPFTNNHILKASGTGGLVLDAGFIFNAGVTGAYAGGGTTNAFAAAGLTATSIVTASILTSTNAVAIAKAVPTTNVLTIIFTADPGAGTTINWISSSAVV